jgi:hypothetical protein
MKYKVLICFRDKDGNDKEESVSIPALTVRDAEHIRRVNEEAAIRKHGKANVISVTLHKIKEK